MAEFLWIGTCLGAVLGLIHAIAVFRQQAASAGTSFASAVYFALWTLVLWTVFGAYVLTFWILGAVGLLLSRLFRRAEAAR